jgi:hypothetical protein
VSYQQPPDDPYQQQRRPSLTPYRQSQPSYEPPQGQQPGRPDLQPTQWYQPDYPPAQRAYPPQAAQAVLPVQHGHHGHHGHRGRRQAAAGKQYGLRGAEGFWYILGCIGFGAAYFSKLPGKKAACEVFSELQLDGQGPSRSYSLRGMEGFWYLLMCLAFGAGYFAKVSAKKALWELIRIVQAGPEGYAEAIGRALSGSAAPRRQGY